MEGHRGLLSSRVTQVTAVDATTAVREAEVRALALLDGEPPDVLHRLVRVAARVSGTSGARINIVTGRAQHTIASAVGPAPPVPVEASMCARILGDPASHQLVPDARDDSRFAGVPMVVDGAVRTYAASPLVTTHDVPIGTLCVYDSDTVAISDAALAVLEELAAAVMAVLEQGRAHEAVRTSLAELAVGTQELRRPLRSPAHALDDQRAARLRRPRGEPLPGAARHEHPRRRGPGGPACAHR
jgi:GAF domain-containing protein